MLSISILSREVASSIRSMALSGRNLSVIYLCERVAAATRAESCILTPWCTSYFSLRPLKMEMVSSTEGSSTLTGWNLLSKAASFSIYLRYSFMVVAPTHLSSPLASAGFSMFDASTAPSAAPAPTIVCISSIKSIISPFESVTSLSTALSLSSNSPLYLAPATSAPISSATTRLFLSVSGISPCMILWASPSTMAVFPTPGSPISTGLFFVLLESTWTTLLISSSRPITGSSLSFAAIAVRSRPNLSSA